MKQAVTFPIAMHEREADEVRYHDQPVTLEILRHAWATQLSLDADILGWSQPVSGSVADVVPWLATAAGGSFTPTPYDYRRHARAYAAALLFRITDGLPHRLACRAGNDDKWAPEQSRDYWRCVAICSAAWSETTGEEA